jgi:serine/threonine protein kinase
VARRHTTIAGHCPLDDPELTKTTPSAMSDTPEDDRTVLSTGSLQAPPANHDHGRAHALPAGTRLGEFEITGVLGEGGFGIVYCAHDTSLERQVALKEYLPSFAERSTQAQVSVRSSQNADSFEAGLRSFINEARMLAQFDHPSLVKVYRFWEANGTAYMVMPFYRGPTLKQALKERKERGEAAPDEAWLKALLAPLLDALDVIHQHSCYHRDIAPDNILMLDEGRPLLLDFGAARRAISGMNQAFTVILKQNYAPIEQYAEMPGMSQGAWTDLYALASVVHFAIDGQAPPTAVSRMLADPYVPLATRYAGRYSAAFLEAIDRALAFRPEGRPQSVAEMRALLGLDRAPASAFERTHMPPPPATAPQAETPPATAAAPAKGRAMLFAGVGALVLGAAGVFVWLNRDKPAHDAVAVAAPPLATRVTEPATAPAPLAAPGAPFDPVAALDAILAGASPERKVTVQVPNARARIDRDKLGFSVRSSHAGYVYIHMVGTADKDIHQLFPNAFDNNNRIKAGQLLTLPRGSWPIEAGGPAGIDHFLVMVSDTPRDFSAAGQTAGGDFAVFPVVRAAELHRDHKGAAPLFAGVPVCAQAPCPATYGAASFSIEEVDY